jgi:hypothetical protein
MAYFASPARRSTMLDRHAAVLSTLPREDTVNPES